MTVFAATAVACVPFGLALGSNPGAGADAQTPDADTSFASEGDGADAGGSCDAGEGAFCDYCDPALVLCVRFADGIFDRSSYHREIALDGGGKPGLVAGALSLDGSFQMTLASGPKLRDNELLSIEVWAKMRALPPSAGRYGLVDREGITGLFVYGDDGAGQPRIRCSGNDALVSVRTDRYMHFACTTNANSQRVRIYLDGEQVLGGDAGVNSPPDGGWDRHFVLMGNDPSGDDFQGEVASIRMYTKVRSPAEIAGAASAAP